MKKNVGLQRMSAISDKLIWIKENLPGLLEDGAVPTRDVMLELIEGLLSRFDEELEQIEIKKSIGKNRRSQHSAREDAITLTVNTEKSEFEGCGLEMPDLLDPQNFKYFTADENRRLDSGNQSIILQGVSDLTSFRAPAKFKPLDCLQEKLH